MKAYEGKGHNETAPEDSVVCNLDSAVNLHHSFIPRKLRVYCSTTDRGGEFRKETPTAFSYVNIHLSGLGIGYLSEWDTNVLIPHFGHAREGLP